MKNTFNTIISLIFGAGLTYFIYELINYIIIKQSIIAYSWGSDAIFQSLNQSIISFLQSDFTSNFPYFLLAYILGTAITLLCINTKN